VQSYICCVEFSYFIWSILQNLRGVLIPVSLFVVVPTYRSTQLSGLRSKVLLIALGDIPDFCSSCF